MSLDLYGTRILGGVITTLKPTVPGFWLNWFNRQFNFDVEEIDFDIVTMDRRIAPFVMPTVAGKPQRERGFSTKKFKPAYVKMLDILAPGRTIARMPGEAIGGGMSLQQRAQAIMTQQLADHRDAIERRWNWMAAQAMLNGSVVVAGEGYPAMTVDFGRNAGHTIALGSDSRWGDANIVPLDNLETWGKLVFDNSGYPVTDVIMGTDAWMQFRKNTEMKGLLDLLRGADRLGGIDILPGSGAPLQYKGTDGQKSYWVYAETYDADESTTVAMMDSRDVLMVASNGLAGARCFGAILDMDSLAAVPIFSKSYVEQNPSARFVLSQSAPLMVPGRPNATLKARVLA